MVSKQCSDFAPIFDIEMRPFLTTFGEVKIGSISMKFQNGIEAM